MLAIQVFAADRKEFLFVIPMPRLLSEYERVFIYEMPEQIAQAERDDPDASDDPEDVEREAQINAAELLGAIARWKREGAQAIRASSDLGYQINAAIMGVVFSNDRIRENFRMMACTHLIQVALPKSVDDEFIVQWAKLTDDLRQGFLNVIDHDETLMDQYVAQAEENRVWLQMQLRLRAN